MGANNSKTKGLGGKDNSKSKGKPTVSVSAFQPTTLSQPRPTSRDPTFVDDQGVVHVYPPVKTISIARLPSPNVNKSCNNVLPLPSLVNPNSQLLLLSSRSRSDSRSSVGQCQRLSM